MKNASVVNKELQAKTMSKLFNRKISIALIKVLLVTNSEQFNCKSNYLMHQPYFLIKNLK